MPDWRTLCFLLTTFLVMLISAYIHEIAEGLFGLCMPDWVRPFWELLSALVRLPLGICRYCDRVRVLLCAILNLLTTPREPYRDPYPGKAWVQRVAKSMHMDKCKALRFWCSTEKFRDAIGIDSTGKLLEEALVFSGDVLAFYCVSVPLYVLLVRRRREARIGAARACCWMLLHAVGVFLFFLDHLRVYDAVFRSIGRAFTWTTFDYMRYLYYNSHQTCEELLTLEPPAPSGWSSYLPSGWSSFLPSGWSSYLPFS